MGIAVAVAVVAVVVAVAEQASAGACTVSDEAVVQQSAAPSLEVPCPVVKCWYY